MQDRAAVMMGDKRRDESISFTFIRRIVDSRSIFAIRSKYFSQSAMLSSFDSSDRSSMCELQESASGQHTKR